MTRVNDHDREAIVELLRRHLLDERLTREELAERVGAAYAADDHAALDALVHDLPLLASGAPARGHSGRHGEVHLPERGWRPTAERFRDPTTNRLMRVWLDVTNGQRHYIAE